MGDLGYRIGHLSCRRGLAEPPSMSPSPFSLAGKTALVTGAFMTGSILTVDGGHLLATG